MSVSTIFGADLGWFGGHVMSDIDGVLCPDPAHDDDGPVYQEAITNAVPLFKPERRLGCLITCRLERWRPITEAWLAEHRIEYDRLIMHPAPTAAARRAGKPYGLWKGEWYRDMWYRHFVESDPIQAATIFRVARKPVYCTANQRFYGAMKP